MYIYIYIYTYICISKKHYIYQNRCYEQGKMECTQAAGPILFVSIKLVQPGVIFQTLVSIFADHTQNLHVCSFSLYFGITWVPRFFLLASLLHTFFEHELCLDVVLGLSWLSNICSCILIVFRVSP